MLTGKAILHHYRANRYLVFTWCVDGAEDEDIVSVDITPLVSGAAKTGSTVSITHQIDVSHADYTKAHGKAGAPCSTAWPVVWNLRIGPPEC